MNVGILTFHENHNPGAYWQARATVELLRDLGHTPMVIHYTHPSHRMGWCSTLSKPHYYRHPLALWDRLTKETYYRRARKEMPLTKRFSTSTEVSKTPFDAVVVGSDVVWDYDTSWRGCAPIYFGEGLNAKRLISFAASCGPVRDHSRSPTYVCEGLQRFAAISVRDQNTREMVHEATNREATVICDPTCTLGNTIKTCGSPPEEAYILLYGTAQFLTETLRGELLSFSRREGLPILAVSYRCKWADRNRVGLDPRDWCAAIRHARYVVTNTFHGTLFSIFHGKAFLTELNEAIASKTSTVLERWDLTSRLYRPGTLAEQIGSPWDVAGVHACIGEEAQHARGFLREALSGSSS